MVEVITCQADRKIGLFKSVSGIPNQYLAIKSVDGIVKDPIEFLGVATNETRKKVKNCARCVGNPNRTCDLSNVTKDDLNSQTKKL